MKKVLAIALVLCLVMGAVFAAKGDIKVGGQLGFVDSFARIKASYDENTYSITKHSVGGFGLELEGLYDVTDEVSVKAALGLSFFGKGKTKATECVLGISESTEVKDDEAQPMKFSAYLGGQYAFEVSKEIKISAGAGLEMVLGKIDSDDDAKNLFSLGVGAEVAGSYAINKNIDVLLGARYSFFFVNSNEDIKDFKTIVEDGGGKFSFNTSALRIFAGCTYKI